MKTLVVNVLLLVLVTSVYQASAGKLSAHKKLFLSKRENFPIHIEEDDESNSYENKGPVERLIAMINNLIGDGGKLLNSLLGLLLPGRKPSIPAGTNQSFFPFKPDVKATSSVGSGMIGGDGGNLVNSVINGVLHNGGGIDNFLSVINDDGVQSANETSDPINIPAQAHTDLLSTLLNLGKGLIGAIL